MQISFWGQTEFKIKGLNNTLIIGGTELPKPLVDIVIPARADLEAQKTKVLVWPGEYEIGEVFITIFPIKQEAPLRAFKFFAEGINFGWLPCLREKLREKEEECYGMLDILFLSAKTEGKIIQNTLEALEPKIVIPMDCAPEELDTLPSKFSSPASEPVAEIKIKRTDLIAGRTELKILTPQKG